MYYFQTSVLLSIHRERKILVYLGHFSYYIANLWNSYIPFKDSSQKMKKSQGYSIFFTNMDRIGAIFNKRLGVFFTTVNIDIFNIDVCVNVFQCQSASQNSSMSMSVPMMLSALQADGCRLAICWGQASVTWLTHTNPTRALKVWRHLVDIFLVLSFRGGLLVQKLGP